MRVIKLFVKIPKKNLKITKCVFMDQGFDLNYFLVVNTLIYSYIYTLLLIEINHLHKLADA